MATTHPWPEGPSTTRKTLIQELDEGRDFATQLKSDGSSTTRKKLIEELDEGRDFATQIKSEGPSTIRKMLIQERDEGRDFATQLKSEGPSTTQKTLIQELAEGMELATQLKSSLHKPLEITHDHASPSPSHEEIISKIMRSYSKSLSILSCMSVEVIHRNLAVSHAASHCDDPRSNDSDYSDDSDDSGGSDDSGENRKRPTPKDRRGCYKGRMKDAGTFEVPLSQAKTDLGFQSQAGNWNKSSEVGPAYTVPERDQESTQSALTRLTGSRDSEGVGDAETIEGGNGANPKRRMKDAGTFEFPLSQAKTDLGLQSQAGNWNKSSQVVPAYTVPERDQESTQTALTRLTGSSDSEGEGDAETIEEGNGSNPKGRMKDAGISEVPLSHKTVAEPKIMVGKGNPYQDKNGEKQIASEPHGMVFNVEPVKMTISSEQKKIEIGEIGNLASQERQPERIQVEEMQPQALSTQGVVFDDGAVKILKSNGQMESQIEDVELEPEASEQCGLFLMQGGLGLTKPPKDDDWKNAKEIYLMDNELSILPENPRCPNLSALFLPRNYKLRTIPVSFFDYMPALQILNLSRTGIKSLPDSLIRLVSLKRLFLNDCHRLMTLSPKVGNLKLLEVLDLEGAKIMDLPMEIKELTNMKCLEVSFYGYMSNGRRAMQSNAVVPGGVISALSQLEELNIDVNPDNEQWDAHVEDIVTEVCTLKKLETLKFYFPRVELLRHFQWNSLSLSHFRFTVGRHVKRIMSRVPLDVEFELERWERSLKYINGVGVPGDIKKVLQHATAFFLDRHATAKKLSNFGIQNMEKLKCIVMGECNELQVIIDEADGYEGDDCNQNVSKSYGTEKKVLGSLEYLYVYYMKSLRSIWEGSVQQNSLFLLKSLTLRTCPQLTTIFTQGSINNLCNLEELKVEDCPSIKSIVCCDIPAEHKTSYFLPKLKKISLHYMPGLVSISGGLRIAPKLEWLSFYNCPNLKNPLIDEVFSQDLKKIKGERSWWEALEWSNGCPGNLDEIFVPIDI